MTQNQTTKKANNRGYRSVTPPTHIALNSMFGSPCSFLSAIGPFMKNNETSRLSLSDRLGLFFIKKMTGFKRLLPVSPKGSMKVFVEVIVKVESGKRKDATEVDPAFVKNDTQGTTASLFMVTLADKQRAERLAPDKGHLDKAGGFLSRNVAVSGSL